MKKLYTIGIGLSFALMASPGFAQVNQVHEVVQSTDKISNDTEPATNKVKRNVRKDDPVVYWSEDFSNGFAGQGDNGAWTTGQDNGNLWLYTFPIGQPNGYDPDAPVDNPAYNGTIPRLSSRNLSIVSSATRDNGVMLLDVDRYNSTATSVEDTTDVTLQNAILSTLVSPSFSLNGVTGNVVLTFTQKLRQCCSGYAATAELSTDGGSTWIPYDVFTPYGGGNDYIAEDVSIDITQALETATSDLSDCKIRFFWAGSAFAYFWSLDDVAVSELAANDLEVDKTFYNDFIPTYEDPAATSLDYYNSFEYNNQPDYLTRPFNFGAIVSNLGSGSQTGVTLHVNATLPDESVVEDYAVSDPITMEAGAVDTIFIAPVMPDVNIAGTYVFSYEVTQNEVDQVPGNNSGDDQSATLTREVDHDGYAIASNDARIASNSAYTTLSEDLIWGVPFVFPEATDGNPKYITHVEAVLYYAPGFAETQAGDLMYFNVRLGSAFDEDPAIPESLTSVVFDSGNPYSYEAQELEHEIADEDIWHTDQTATPVWVSFELPSPVLVDANTFYQAEFRVPAGYQVFSTIAQRQELGAGLWYDNGATTPGWTLGGNSATQVYNGLAIRFRTANDPTLVETISQENGMQLVQNYPNPFTTSTMIQYRLEETSQASLEVRDLTGKLVFNKDLGMVVGATANRYELQRGSLAPGLYTYSIVTSANTITRKLIVE